MPSQLPYLTSPQTETHIVGTPEIGELQIKKLKDLSINERNFIRLLGKEHGIVDMKKETIKLAEKLAGKLGGRVLDLYNALTQNNTEILADHLGDVVEFQEMMERNNRERVVVMATTILRFRVSPEWTYEDTADADLIHPDLVRAVALFAMQEEAGWPTPAQEEEAAAAETEPTEEDLGKS